MWAQLALAGLSALSSMRAARQQRNLQNQLLDYAKTMKLPDLGLNVGDISVSNSGVDFGALGGLQTTLRDAAGGVLSNFDPTAGMPSDVTNALDWSQQFLMPSVDPGYGQLDAQSGMAGAVTGQAFSDLLGGSNFAGGLGSSVFGKAGDMLSSGLLDQGSALRSAGGGLLGDAFGLAGQLGGNFNEVRDQTLQALRASAQPFEQRQFQDLQQNLFNTGQLGTTGGSLQTEAFARGLGQADLQRQLVAGQEARNTSADIASRFGSLMSGFNTANQAGNFTDQTAGGLLSSMISSGLGLNSGDQQNIMNAFSRFAGGNQLGLDLSNTAFNRGMSLDQLMAQRAQQNFADVAGIQLLPSQLQTGQLNVANTLLGSLSGLQNMGLNAYQAAQQFAAAQANVKLNALGNMFGLVGGRGFNADPVSSGLGSLTFGLAGGQNGIQSAFQGLIQKLGGSKGIPTTTGVGGDLTV